MGEGATRGNNTTEGGMFLNHLKYKGESESCLQPGAWMVGSKRHHLKRTLVETFHGDRILIKVQKYKNKMSE